MTSVSAYFYGDDAAAVAASEPKWLEWMGEKFQEKVS